jgi:FtsZ-interacting cell division protein ZipA
MKKSLLIWGVLVIVALCFVGCCYYNTTHNHQPCSKHCHHKPCCNEAGKECPDDKKKDTNADNDEVESVTVEEVEIIPVNAPADQNQPAAKKTAAPAARTEQPATGK